MEPPTVFALPRHLAHKAVPHELAADESHFAAVAATLERAVADLTDARGHPPCPRRVRPAGPGPRPRGAPALRQAPHAAASRLDLCLVHTVAEGTPSRCTSAGSGSPRRRAPPARRLASPAAEPFFAATHARPMGLVEPPPVPLERRPHHRLLGRGLHRGGPARPRRPRRPVGLHREPRASRSERMRDVLGTIQADQDAIIRAGRTAPSSSTAAPGPVRRWSRCTARLPAVRRPPARPPPRGCSSSGPASPTWPTSRTCCRASARRACSPAPCATCSPRGRAPAPRPTPGWPG